MTITDRVIGIAKTYDELMAALDARMAEFNVTNVTLDAISGLPSGYCSKLFAPVPIKGIGRISMGPILGALGLKIVVVEDAESLARVSTRLTPRAKCAPPRHYAGAVMLAQKRRKTGDIWRGNAEWGRIMRAKQLVTTSPQQRSRTARKAAQFRWKRKGKAAVPLDGDMKVSAAQISNNRKGFYV